MANTFIRTWALMTELQKKARGLEWIVDLIVQLPDNCTVPKYFDADNIVPLTLILFGTLVGVYVVTVCSGFRLTKLVGAIFFSMYFLFVAYVLMHEFHMISF